MQGYEANKTKVSKSPDTRGTNKSISTFATSHHPHTQTPTMGMLRLPTELLLSIFERLEYCWDINSLAQTNRRPYGLLDHGLYQRNIHSFGASALLWAAEHGNESVTKRMLDLLDEIDLAIINNDTVSEAMRLAASNGHEQVIGVFMQEIIGPKRGKEKKKVSITTNFGISSWWS